MADNLNGIGLASLSSGYMNSASQIAQNEAGSLFASLLPAGSTATSDSASFSLASIAALADAGMLAVANASAVANGNTSGATPDPAAAASSTSQAAPVSSVIPTVLDSFAGVTPQPLVSLPSPVAPATGGSAVNQMV